MCLELVSPRELWQPAACTLSAVLPVKQVVKARLHLHVLPVSFVQVRDQQLHLACMHLGCFRDVSIAVLTYRNALHITWI